MIWYPPEHPPINRFESSDYHHQGLGKIGIALQPFLSRLIVDIYVKVITHYNLTSQSGGTKCQTALFIWALGSPSNGLFHLTAPAPSAADTPPERLRCPVPESGLPSSCKARRPAKTPAGAVELDVGPRCRAFSGPSGPPNFVPSGPYSLHVNSISWMLSPQAAR